MAIKMIQYSSHYKEKEHEGFKHIPIKIIDYLDPQLDNATLDMLEDSHVK